MTNEERFTLLEGAIELLANDLAETKERLENVESSNTVSRVLPQEVKPEPVTEALTIGKAKYHIKYPAWKFNGTLYKAQDMVKDKDALRQHLEDNPAAFVSVKKK